MNLNGSKRNGIIVLVFAVSHHLYRRCEKSKLFFYVIVNYPTFYKYLNFAIHLII